MRIDIKQGQPPKVVLYVKEQDAIDKCIDVVAGISLAYSSWSNLEEGLRRLRSLINDGVLQDVRSDAEPGEKLQKGQGVVDRVD